MVGEVVLLTLMFGAAAWRIHRAWRRIRPQFATPPSTLAEYRTPRFTLRPGPPGLVGLPLLLCANDRYESRLSDLRTLRIRARHR